MDERFQSLMFTIPVEEDNEARVLEELRKAAERAAGAGPAKVEI